MTPNNFLIRAPLEARAMQSHLASLLLLHNLAGFGSYNLGCPVITRDLSRYTNLRIPIFRLGSAEFAAVAAPNQDREHLFWIRLVEVQECRLTFAARSEVRAGYLSADGLQFSNVVFGFTRSNFVGLRCGAQRHQKKQEAVRSTFHGLGILFYELCCKL